MLMGRLVNSIKRLFGLCLGLLKKLILLGILSVIIISLLMITPFFSDVMLFVMGKIPVVVNTTAQKQTKQMIVVLGGGLRKKKNQEIVLNSYTKSRLKTATKLHHQNKLPILFSGVEGRWAKQWFVTSKVPADKLILENKSMNTCENANFTTIKLKELGINHIYLVTDAYHQQRASMNFARNGIYTTPISSSLGQTVKSWETPQLNFDNNRRAVYELLAILRDKYRPQSIKDCQVLPRKNAKPNFDEFNLKSLITNIDKTEALEAEKFTIEHMEKQNTKNQNADKKNTEKKKDLADNAPKAENKTSDKTDNKNTQDK